MSRVAAVAQGCWEGESAFSGGEFREQSTAVSDNTDSSPYIGWQELTEFFADGGHTAGVHTVEDEKDLPFIRSLSNSQFALVVDLQADLPSSQDLLNDLSISWESCRFMAEE